MSRSDWRKLAKVVGLASAAFLIVGTLYGFGYYAGNSSGYYKSEQDRAASQYADDTQAAVDRCFQLPARADASECVSKAYETSHENQRAEKDLTAQRQMADWAWWVMIVSVFQFLATIVTLAFVKLTLDATLEAVKDTGDATKAMVESNRIAIAAQRPWVSINASLIGYSRMSPHALNFEWEVRFTNTGNMMAENFHTQTRLIPTDHNFLDHTRSWFSNFEDNEIEKDVVLAPGQTSKSGAWSGYSIDHLPWETEEGHRKDCVIMVLAMARYRIADEKKWRLAMRGFVIGEKISSVDDCHIIYDHIDALTLGDLHIRPLGISRAT